MFTEKMARLTSDFTAQILVALRAASLEELSARRPRAEKPSPAKPSPAVKRAAVKRAAKPKPNVERAATPTLVKRAARTPDGAVMRTSLAYFADRGRKGATADQLGAHLNELGLADGGDLVIAALAEQGAIRDAGFRRSTGTGHKTSVVWVSSS